MKIHICGIYGSGKSTLAKILSKQLGIKSYSLDDIKYIIKYSKIRPVNERIKKVKEICRRDNWITEGTWSDYALDAFRKSDMVIFIDTPKRVCVFRILKRHLKMKKLENDNFRGSLKLAKEVYRYHFTKNPVSLYSHKNLIKKYNKKCIVLKSKKDLLKLIESFKV